MTYDYAMVTYDWIRGHRWTEAPKQISSGETKVKLTTTHFFICNSKTGGLSFTGALNFLNWGGEYGRGLNAELFVVATGP